MRKWLNPRTGLLVAGALILVAVGIVYAIEISRDDIQGLFVLGTVQTPEETIRLFREGPPSTADLVELNFGTGDLDAFGFFLPRRGVPFWAANSGGAQFLLTVQATNVAITRNGVPIKTGSGIIGLLMGPAGGKLLLAPNHGTVLNVGAPPVALEVGIQFLQTPAKLGLVQGDRVTFTALFKAVAPVPTPTPTPTPTPAPVPPGAKYGGVAPLAGQWDPGFLDLHFTASLNSGLLVAAPRFNQLVEFNPVNPTEIIGDLAVRWVLSSGGSVYTFYLHPDAKWTDSHPVTADDIVFSLDRIVDPNAVRRRAGAALKPFYARGTATVIDDKTVEIPLKFASAAFLPWLAFDYIKMYPKHITESLTQEEVNCCYENMLGSGPWIFAKLERGSSLEWEKNPNYFKAGRPFWDGWKSFLIKDQGRTIASLQTE